VGPASSQIRLLLVEDVAQVARYIRELLDAQEKVKLLDVLTEGRSAVDKIRELRPDVLIVDALLQGKTKGLEVAERVRKAGLDLPIICLTVPQKPVTVGEGMGILKVLSMPFSGFALLDAVESAHAEQEARAPGALSRVYSVFAAKGGVGKTTIAFNLAVSTATIGAYRVALVDGSLQFADLRALLRVPEGAPSLLQLPTDRISESDLQEVLWRDPSGVDILLAPPRVEMADMVTTRDIEKCLSLLRRLYDVVVIDTPSHIDDTVLAFFDGSDAIIQVVTPDHTTLHNTRLMAETFRAMGYPMEKVRYLMNRSDSTGGSDPRAMKELLGADPEFSLVSDGRLVVASNNQGRPFVQADPAAPISRDMERIATTLLASPVSAVAGVHR
jgi:pilus assembly protein CpaE